MMKSNTNIKKHDENMKMDTLEVCRLCLSFTTNLQNIFVTDSKQPLLYKTLTECTSLKAHPEDGLPPYVCYDCLKIINAIQEFRTQCIKSHVILEKCLQFKTKQSIIKCLKDVKIDMNKEIIKHVIKPEQATKDQKSKRKKKRKIKPYPLSHERRHSRRFKKTEPRQEIDKRLREKYKNLIIKDPIVKVIPLDCDQNIDYKSLIDKEIETGSELSNEKSTASNEENLLDKKLTNKRYSKRILNANTLNIKEGNDSDIFNILQEKGKENFVESTLLKNIFFNNKKEKDHFEMNVIEFSNKTKDLTVEKKPENEKIEQNPEKVHPPSPKPEKETKKDIKEQSNYIKGHELCHICGKSTACLWKHQLTHQDSRNIKCPECDKTFANDLLMRKHLNSTHPLNRKIHRCAQCNSTFSCSSSLNRHIRDIHNAKRTHLCIVCSKRFKNAYTLKIHKITHSREPHYECKKCQKSFTSNRVLMEHMHFVHKQTVTQLQLYPCTVCGELLTSNRLVLHRKIHENEKTRDTFKCTYCTRYFFNKSYLSMHIERKHNDSDQTKLLNGSHDESVTETLECVICNKKFKQLRYLKQHVKLHDIDGKRHQCDICGKKFQYKTFLRDHLKVHSGERPAECKICGKRYVNFRLLKKHLAIHISNVI